MPQISEYKSYYDVNTYEQVMNGVGGLENGNKYENSRRVDRRVKCKT